MFAIAWIIFFFAGNEAPITRGDVELNIEYKEGLFLDVYRPTKMVFEESPVVIFIHGGAWIVGRKEFINMNRIHGAINKLRSAGYTIVCPEYTLASEDKSPFPDCINDAYDMLGWVRKNGVEMGLDTSRVGVIGESAGGHIALMLAYANDSLFSNSFATHKLDYVVNIYGPSELEGLYNSASVGILNELIDELPEPVKTELDITRQLFGFNPREDSARAQKVIELNSPTEYLRKGLPPTLSLHGEEDHLVPVQQSINLHAKLDEIGVENELRVFSDVDHAFIGASREQKSSIQKLISEFVLEHSARLE